MQRGRVIYDRFRQPLGLLAGLRLGSALVVGGGPNAAPLREQPLGLDVGRLSGGARAWRGPQQLTTTLTPARLPGQGLQLRSPRRHGSLGNSGTRQPPVRWRRCLGPLHLSWKIAPK